MNFRQQNHREYTLNIWVQISNMAIISAIYESGWDKLIANNNKFFDNTYYPNLIREWQLFQLPQSVRTESSGL